MFEKCHIAADITTTLHKKSCKMEKKSKSIKSLSLRFYHRTLKYRSNNNQFEHTLFTHSVSFFDLSLIARSLLLSFLYHQKLYFVKVLEMNAIILIQKQKKTLALQLKETLKRNGEAKNHIDTHTRYVYIHIDDGKANEQIKK